MGVGGQLMPIAESSSTESVSGQAYGEKQARLVAVLDRLRDEIVQLHRPNPEDAYALHYPATHVTTIIIMKGYTYLNRCIGML